MIGCLSSLPADFVRVLVAKHFGLRQPAAAFRPQPAAVVGQQAARVKAAAGCSSPRGGQETGVQAGGPSTAAATCIVYILNISDTFPFMLVGWTTTATREDAERLATDAVERHLAACCHVDGPFLSIYNWEGVLHKEEEYRVTFKFLSQKTAALENWLWDNHPYENPQWVAVAAERISQKYLIWAQKETT